MTPGALNARAWMVVAAFCLAGCNQELILQKMVSGFGSEDRVEAEYYVEKLQKRQFAAIEEKLDARLRQGNAREMLAAMADTLPEGEPTSVKVVGFQKQMGRSVNITLEYGFGEKWFLVNLVIETKDGKRRITNFRVQPTQQSLEAFHKFTFSGKGVSQYAGVGLAVGVLALQGWALFALAYSKNIRRRVLWIIFVLIGFGAFTLNWTTGEWTFQLLFLGLGGSSVGPAPYGPWLITVSVPVGAIIVLYRALMPAPRIVATESRDAALSAAERDQL